MQTSPFVKVTFRDKARSRSNREDGLSHVLMSREHMDDVHGCASVAIGMDAETDWPEQLVREGFNIAADFMSPPRRHKG